MSPQERAEDVVVTPGIRLLELECWENSEASPGTFLVMLICYT